MPPNAQPSTPPRPTYAHLLRHPIHCLSLGLGSGLAPNAPGTFGTLAAIVPYLLIALLPLWGQLVVIVLGFGFGIYCCHRTAAAMGVHDHPAIVWDEFVGFWVTMLALPLFQLTFGQAKYDWTGTMRFDQAQWGAIPLSDMLLYVVLGFVLFRFFDILKPWPIRWIDCRIHGGFGIMLDDLLAGIYSALVLWGLLWGLSLLRL